MDKLYSIAIRKLGLSDRLIEKFKTDGEAFKNIVMTASQLCTKTADIEDLRKAIDIAKNLNECIKSGGQFIVNKDNLDRMKENMKNAKGWTIDEDIGLLILTVQERILNAKECAATGGDESDAGAGQTI